MNCNKDKNDQVTGLFNALFTGEIGNFKVAYDDFDADVQSLLISTQFYEIRTNPYITFEHKTIFLKWLKVRTDDNFSFVYNFFKQFSSRLESIYQDTNLLRFVIVDVLMPKLEKRYNLADSLYVQILKRHLTNHTNQFYKQTKIFNKVLLDVRANFKDKNLNDHESYNKSVYMMYFDDLLTEFFKMFSQPPIVDANDDERLMELYSTDDILIKPESQNENENENIISSNDVNINNALPTVDKFRDLNSEKVFDRHLNITSSEDKNIILEEQIENLTLDQRKIVDDDDIKKLPSNIDEDVDNIEPEDDSIILEEQIKNLTLDQTKIVDDDDIKNLPIIIDENVDNFQHIDTPLLNVETKDGANEPTVNENTGRLMQDLNLNSNEINNPLLNLEKNIKKRSILDTDHCVILDLVVEDVEIDCDVKNEEMLSKMLSPTILLKESEKNVSNQESLSVSQDVFTQTESSDLHTPLGNINNVEEEIICEILPSSQMSKNLENNTNENNLNTQEINLEKTLEQFTNQTVNDNINKINNDCERKNEEMMKKSLPLTPVLENLENETEENKFIFPLVENNNYSPKPKIEFNAMPFVFHNYENKPEILKFGESRTKKNSNLKKLKLKVPYEKYETNKN